MEKKKPLFEFDLEVDLKKDLTKRKALLAEVEKKLQKIKTELREGKNSAEFDQLGILLHGYSALQKVLNRIPTK